MDIVEKKGHMMLLPPPPDHCQICAVKHEPDEPHDPESLYYQLVFHNENGRKATWADAMAHCPDEVKELWTIELKKHGIEVLA
jgi:hypothetical protein